MLLFLLLVEIILWTVLHTFLLKSSHIIFKYINFSVFTRIYLRATISSGLDKDWKLTTCQRCLYIIPEDFENFIDKWPEKSTVNNFSTILLCNKVLGAALVWTLFLHPALVMHRGGTEEPKLNPPPTSITRGVHITLQKKHSI